MFKICQKSLYIHLFPIISISLTNLLGELIRQDIYYPRFILLKKITL